MVAVIDMGDQERDRPGPNRPIQPIATLRLISTLGGKLSDDSLPQNWGINDPEACL